MSKVIKYAIILLMLVSCENKVVKIHKAPEKMTPADSARFDSIMSDFNKQQYTIDEIEYKTQKQYLNDISIKMDSIIKLLNKSKSNVEK